jgi:hypothetical protein
VCLCRETLSYQKQEGFQGFFRKKTQWAKRRGSIHNFEEGRKWYKADFQSVK